jgi:hypothetical protein
MTATLAASLPSFDSVTVAFAFLPLMGLSFVFVSVLALATQAILSARQQKATQSHASQAR